MELPYPNAVERFPRLRQSTLSDADNCMLSSHFGLTFEQGWSSHPAARGQIVHRTIARCLELLEDNYDPDDRFGDLVPVDVGLEVFEEVIRQHTAAMQSDEGDQVVNLPLREVAQARVSLKALFANHRFSVEWFAGIERRLDTTISYPDENGEAVERVLTGRMDLLLIDPQTQEEAIVVDWKDTFGIPSEGKRGRPEFDGDDDGDLPDTDLSEEGYFQQRFYALLIFHFYPRVQRVTLREFYVRYAGGKAKDRRGRPINPVREATIDRFVLPEIEAEIRALVERFDRAQETGVFTPSPGSHCSYCARPNRCPILPEARVEGMIQSQEHAELVAGRVQVVSGYMRSARAALRRWSNWHGDVYVKDAKRPRVFGPVVRTEERKPTRREIEEAVRQGRDPAELYREREVVKFAVHSPEEEHPLAAAARAEEEMLLAAEKAEAERR